MSPAAAVEAARCPMNCGATRRKLYRRRNVGVVVDQPQHQMPDGSCGDTGQIDRDIGAVGGRGAAQCRRLPFGNIEKRVAAGREGCHQRQSLIIDEGRLERILDQSRAGGVEHEVVVFERQLRRRGWHHKRLREQYRERVALSQLGHPVHHRDAPLPCPAAAGLGFHPAGQVFVKFASGDGKCLWGGYIAAAVQGAATVLQPHRNIGEAARTIRRRVGQRAG